MRMLARRNFLKVSALAPLACAWRTYAGNRPLPAKPSRNHLVWQNSEMGMFIHFGLFTYYGRGWEWRTFKNMPSPDLFQPRKLDTDQWMEAAKAMGAKYAILVVKHCDGFMLWQTDIYPYGVRQSSWHNHQGDVLASFIESCNRYKIKPGLYASLSANAWFGVDNPGRVNYGRGGNQEAQKRYNTVCEKMMVELWSRYGQLFEVWFDGGVLPSSSGGPNILPIYQKYQPNAIAFQGPREMPNLIRWVGNERGVAPYPCWATTDIVTAEGGDAEASFPGNPDGHIWAPGECDVPIRGTSWSWFADEENKVLSLDALMDIYNHSVGRNCNLLLNANPNQDGLIPEPDFKRYVEFGDKIRARYGKSLAETSGTGLEFTLRLLRPAVASSVILMEDIVGGESIRAYQLQGVTPLGEQVTLGSGTCVGHKHIQTFAPVILSAVIFRVIQSVARPRIRRFAVFA